VNPEVTVLGVPFLDLVFVGLERAPIAGEELVARTCRWVPGGAAVQAVGVSRLGLGTELLAPKPADAAGAVLAASLDAERVAWRGPHVQRAAVTAILPGGEGAAMATSMGDGWPEGAAPPVDAPILVRPLLASWPLRGRERTIAVTGPLELLAGAAALRARVPEADVLIATEAELVAIAEVGDGAAAAIALSRGGPTVVATCGAGGAWVALDGEVAPVPAPQVDLDDATGAGDLFVAAYAWADRSGAGPRAAARWACLAAGLSVRAPTAIDGAVRADELLEEGDRRGLGPLAGVSRP
jgi:sugar/nucleoside kinase (ribokinase family)